MATRVCTAFARPSVSAAMASPVIAASITPSTPWPTFRALLRSSTPHRPDALGHVDIGRREHLELHLGAAGPGGEGNQQPRARPSIHESSDPPLQTPYTDLRRGVGRGGPDPRYRAAFREAGIWVVTPNIKVMAGGLASEARANWLWKCRSSEMSAPSWSWKM